MAYWRLCYHFVWTTKDRMPIIVPEFEPNLYAWLRNEAKKMYAPFCYVGGISDHVHVVTAFRPSIAPAEFVKQLKGSSSRFISLEYGIPFAWQKGYGVFSVSESAIDAVKRYVLNQKIHHAHGDIIAAWEEANDWNLGPDPEGDTTHD